MEPKERLKRREFIANILFAGSALTFASLDEVLGGPDEGWELPKDWKNPNPPPPKPPRPRPRPTRTPPPIDGGVRPPHPRGIVRPPQPRPKPKK